MSSENFTFDTLKSPSRPSLREDDIEYGFIGTLQKLKYEYRKYITDRTSLEKNTPKNGDIPFAKSPFVKTKF